jgi:3-(methylthio)propionyl---CoA ligase
LSMDGESLLAYLRDRVAGWWLPEQILYVDAMPLAATGKIDKNQLRADYANGKLTAE